MEPSAALKKDNGPSERFLREIIEFQGVIGGIMSVIHPEQHFEGRGAFLSHLHSKAKGTADEACFERLMKVWGTGFMGLSVISEWETPLHCDGQNADWMYDVLVNIATNVDPDIRAELPGIGIQFRYNSSTVLSILGKAVQHGVSKTNIDRYCLAFFMRQRVSECLGFPHEVMMSEKLFKKWLFLDELERAKAMLRIQKGRLLPPLEF